MMVSMEQTWEASDDGFYGVDCSETCDDGFYGVNSSDLLMKYASFLFVS